MTGEADRDLPLHDEAKARSKWRGGGPGPDTDDAATDGGLGPSDELLKDLSERPPD